LGREEDGDEDGDGDEDEGLDKDKKVVVVVTEDPTGAKNASQMAGIVQLHTQNYEYVPVLGR
jgi:hypothetical protein